MDLKSKADNEIKVEVKVVIPKGDDGPGMESGKVKDRAGNVAGCKSKACKHNKDGKCGCKVEINNAGECISFAPVMANVARGKPEIDKPLKMKQQKTENTMVLERPPKMRETNRNAPVVEKREDGDTGNMVLLKG